MPRSLIKAFHLSAEGEPVVLGMAVQEADGTVVTQSRESIETLYRDAQIHLTEAKKKSDEIIAEAEEQARSILAQAQAQAGLAQEDAQSQAEDIRAKAYEEGYARGLEEGENEALEQARKILAQLEAALEQGFAHRREMLQNVEKEVVGLALAVAEKILAVECRTNPEVPIALVEGALSRLTEKEEVTIRLAAADTERIQPVLGKRLDQLLPESRVRLVADPSLQPGECLIETEYGCLDATFKTQLDAVVKEFRSLLDMVPHEPAAQPLS